MEALKKVFDITVEVGVTILVGQNDINGRR